MTEQVQTLASDESLQDLVLVRQQHHDESGRSAALEQIAAMLALCGDWLTPLAVSLRVENREPDDYYFADDAHPPPRQFWLLRRRVWDERLSLRSYWHNPEERLVDAVGSAELMAFAEEALAQPPSESALRAAMPELAVTAVSIALPEGMDLEPRYNGRPVHPVSIQEGQRRAVLGPTAGAAASMPVRLNVTDQYGTSRIALELCWDFWTKHPAGIAQLRSALERVFARGRCWQLEREETP